MNDTIDPALLEPLREDREAEPPPDAQARVASRLGLGVPSPPQSTAPGGSAARVERPALPTVPHAASSFGRGALAAVFLGGAAVGALLHATLQPARVPASRVIYVERPAPAAASAPAPSTPIPAPSAAIEPAPAVPALSPHASASSVAANAHGGLSQLDAERALLDEAHTALVRGESDAALSALERHARAYPHPLLGEERDALYVQALVHAGRYAEARSRAEAFRRSRPQSLLLAAVDAAIASIP